MDIEELKSEITKDMQIDFVDLDTEALNIPKLYAKWMNILQGEAFLLKKLDGKFRQVKLKRWKFYNSKLPADHYVNEPLHEKILKSDIPLYLSADKDLIECENVLSEQKHKVTMIEGVMKQIPNRSFQIRDAIDWRKFESGAR